MGGVQLTNAWPVAGVAETFCGAEGGVAPKGVIGDDGADSTLVPAEFVAVTVNV
jgi:hypothetical protein